MDTNVISQASLALVLIEGLKSAIRAILKNPTYDFPKTFYVVALPIAQVVAGLLLAVLGVDGYTLPTDWVSFLKAAILMVLGSFTSVLLYNGGFKPVKEYIPSALKAASKSKKTVTVVKA